MRPLRKPLLHRGLHLESLWLSPRRSCWYKSKRLGYLLGHALTIHYQIPHQTSWADVSQDLVLDSSKCEASTPARCRDIAFATIRVPSDSLTFQLLFLRFCLRSNFEVQENDTASQLLPVHQKELSWVFQHQKSRVRPLKLYLDLTAWRSSQTPFPLQHLEA